MSSDADSLIYNSQIFEGGATNVQTPGWGTPCSQAEMSPSLFQGTDDRQPQPPYPINDLYDPGRPAGESSKEQVNHVNL